MAEVICPKCGSKNVHKVGAVALHSGHGYRCIDCGAGVDGPDYDLPVEFKATRWADFIGKREDRNQMMHPFMERLLKWFFGITDKKGDKFR